MRLENHKAYKFLFRNRFRNLFVSLLALIFIPFFLPETRLTDAINSAFFSIVLFVSLSFTKPRSVEFIFKLSLSVICFVGFGILAFYQNPFLQLGISLMALIFFSTVGNTIWKAIKNIKEVNADVITGALAGYLIIGIVGSLLLAATVNIDPAALRFPEDTLPNYRNILYYTLVSMTTLGYGEITPVTKVAKGTALLVTLAGQIYLTVVIAILIGKYLSQKKN